MTTTLTSNPSVRIGALVKQARSIMRKDKGLNGDLDRLPILTWLMFLKFIDDSEADRELEADLLDEPFRPLIEAPYRWREWAAEPSPTGDDLLRFVSGEEVVGPDGETMQGLFAYLRDLDKRSEDSRAAVISAVFGGIDNRMKSGYLLRDVVSLINEIKFDSSEELYVLGSIYEQMLREMRDAAGDSGEFYTPRPVVKLLVDLVDPRLGEMVLDPASGTGGFLVESFLHLKSQVLSVKDRTLLQNDSILGGEPKSLPFLLSQMNLILHGLESPKIDPGNSLRNKLTEIGDSERVDVILTNPPFGGEEERGIQSNFPPELQTAETALLFLQVIMRRLRRTKTAADRPPRAGVVVPNGTLFADGVAARLRRKLIEEFNLVAVIRLPKGVFEPYTDIAANLLIFEAGAATKNTWFYEVQPPSGKKKYSKTTPLSSADLDPVRAWWSMKRATTHAWSVAPEALAQQNWRLDVRNPRLPAEHESASLATTLESAHAQTTQIASALSSVGSSPATGTTRLFQLRDLLTRRREPLDDNEPKREITVKLWGKGVVARAASEPTTKRYRVRANDLVYSKIDARSGAFGVIPPSLDNYCASADFPIFEVNTNLVLPHYLAGLVTSAEFVAMCSADSRGTTNRVRLNEERFLALEVALPSIETQGIVVSQMAILAQAESMAIRLASDLQSARVMLAAP